MAGHRWRGQPKTEHLVESKLECAGHRQASEERILCFDYIISHAQARERPEYPFPQDDFHMDWISVRYAKVKLDKLWRITCLTLIAIPVLTHQLKIAFHGHNKLKIGSHTFMLLANSYKSMLFVFEIMQNWPRNLGKTFFTKMLPNAFSSHLLQFSISGPQIWPLI